MNCHDRYKCWQQLTQELHACQKELRDLSQNAPAQVRTELGWRETAIRQERMHAVSGGADEVGKLAESIVGSGQLNSQAAEPAGQHGAEGRAAPDDN